MHTHTHTIKQTNNHVFINTCPHRQTYTHYEVKKTNTYSNKINTNSTTETKYSYTNDRMQHNHQLVNMTAMRIVKTN